MLWVNPSDQSNLSTYGLNSLADFVQLPTQTSIPFETVFNLRTQWVIRVELSEKVYYLKSQLAEKRLPMIESFLSGRGFNTGFVREGRTLYNMRQKHLSAGRPAAFGQGSIPDLGFTSFLLTEEVKGTPLDELYTQDREDLVEAYGQLFGQLHKESFWQQLRMKDVIVEPTGTLVTIDREDTANFAIFPRAIACIEMLARSFRWDAKYQTQLFESHLPIFWEHYLQASQLSLSPDRLEYWVKKRLLWKWKISQIHR